MHDMNRATLIVRKRRIHLCFNFTYGSEKHAVVLGSKNRRIPIIKG